MSLPDFVSKRVDTIHQRTGIDREEIIRDYWEIFKDPFISDDPQFSTDEERHNYAKAVLWTHYVSRPPTKEFDVIPVGFSPVKVARKTGQPYSNVFAFVKGKAGAKFKRIVLQGENAGKVREITPKCKYTVKLGEFAQGGDLIGDNRARFEDPVLLKMTDEQVLQRIGAKRVDFQNVAKFLSQKGSDGYVVATDWRVIRGIIIRSNQGKRDDGSEWGVYTIADDTVEDEPRVSATGQVIRPGFSCWIAPHLMGYTDDSEVDIAGTTRKNRAGVTVMDAYWISPIHAKEIASV